MRPLPNPTIWESKNPSGKVVYKVEATIAYVNGKPKRTRRTVATKNQARELKREFLKLQSMGQLEQVSNTTVFDYGLHFIRVVRSGRIKPSSQSNYEQRLRTNIAPFLGGIYITELTATDIERWMHFLKAEGHSVATINGARRVLFGILKHAERAGLIFRNPVALTDAMSKDNAAKTRVRDPWSKEEILRAFEVSKNTELDLFLRMAILLGMRRGEILGLTYSDINFVDGYLTVSGTLKEQRVIDDAGKGTVTLVKDSPKTQSSRRSIGLSWPIIEAMQRHKELTEFKKQSASTWSETDWVFKSTKGTAWYPSNFYNLWRKFCKDNELRFIRIHDLRHTTGHRAMEAGLSLSSLSETMGHTRLETTKNIYAANVARLSIEFPSAFTESLLPMDEQLRSELNRQKQDKDR